LPYWIGAQLYSVRYYSDGLTAASLLAALALNFALDGIVMFFKRFLICSIAKHIYIGIFVLITISGFFRYTQPRLESLRNLYKINRAILDVAISYERSFGNTLVLIKHKKKGQQSAIWTKFSPLLSVTSPNLNSPITAILDLDGTIYDYESEFSGRRILRVEFSHDFFSYSVVR
jgi:hypothetical protein